MVVAAAFCFGFLVPCLWWFAALAAVGFLNGVTFDER